MDPLSAVSGVFTILQATILLSNPTFKAYYDIRQARKGVERSLLGQNYGWLVATFVTVLSPETATQYEEIDANVLQGGDEETLAFRQAITDESNMTAIAVSRSPPLLITTAALLIAKDRVPLLPKSESQD